MGSEREGEEDRQGQRARRRATKGEKTAKARAAGVREKSERKEREARTRARHSTNSVGQEMTPCSPGASVSIAQPPGGTPYGTREGPTLAKRHERQQI